MAEPPIELPVIREIQDQMGLLLFSGIGGAFLRAILAPNETWRGRLVQGFSGAISAIFLGGVFTHLVVRWTGAPEAEAALAAGFLLGVGGMWGIRKVQQRLFEKK